MCFHEMRRADGSALMLNLAPSPSRTNGLMERRDRQTYRPELASSNISFHRTGTSTPYCTPYPDHEARMRTPMERHFIVTSALTPLLAACTQRKAPSTLNSPRARALPPRHHRTALLRATDRHHRQPPASRVLRGGVGAARVPAPEGSANRRHAPTERLHHRATVRLVRVRENNVAAHRARAIDLERFRR